MKDSGERFGDVDAAAAGFDPARMALIRTAFEREITAGRLPGAVMAVARGNRLAYFDAFGVRDPASSAAMSTDAVFSIASMTKPMTSVAIMQLFEQGRLLLGDPISAHLPEFADVTRGIVDADGQLRRVGPGRPPTIQDLLRHTSGLTYQNRGETPVHAAYPGSSATAAMALTRQQAIDTLASCPLLFEPGTAWEYGFSTDVLGFIVEAVSGQSLGQYLAENVWNPLGLTDTAFELDAASRPRFATPFKRDPLTGEAQTVYHQRPGTKHWEAGGAGAVSTAADYLAFAEALRQGGSLAGARVLGAKTVRLMTTDHLEAGLGSRIADTMDPAAEGYGFGLGFAVRRANGVSALAGTAGDYYWSGVFGTYFWVDPAEELSCVVMAAAPGAMRLRFRQLSRALVYQAMTG
ncbi:MAG: serine hydrolase domain-containing protein [Hyphomicrobiaceae bacterium]